MSNPFAASSMQIGSAGVQAGLPVDPKGAVREHARFSALDELPGDWWSLAENEPGGYQYRTVAQVLGKRVECMLDGCAGANHVTEELLVGTLNRAAELGIGTEDPRFPVVKLVEDPSVVTFLGSIPEENSWWEEAGGVASVWGRRPKADELSSAF